MGKNTTKPGDTPAPTANFGAADALTFSYHERYPAAFSKTLSATGCQMPLSGSSTGSAISFNKQHRGRGGGGRATADKSHSVSCAAAAEGDTSDVQTTKNKKKNKTT